MVDPWHEVVDGLWMGGDDASPVGRFDHVVSLCAWGEAVCPGPAGQTEWFIDDGLEVRDRDRIWEVAREVNQRLERGQSVLVRCQMGLNRSGLITGAVLIDRGWPPRQAIDHIRARRDELALCNTTFEAWLLRQDGPGA